MNIFFEKLISEFYENLRSIEFDDYERKKISIIQAGQSFLSQCSNPNCIGTDGNTPLMSIANVDDSIDLIQEFVEAGADVNILNHFNGYALLNSAYNESQHVFNYLLPLTNPKLRKYSIEVMKNGWEVPEKARLEKQISLENFIRYAFKGDIGKMKQVLEDRDFLNDIGADGQSALHKAVMNGKLSSVMTLLEMGAYPMTENHQRKTPIDIAEEYKNDYPEIFDCLHNANILFEDFLEESFDRYRELELNGEALWLKIVRDSAIRFLEENRNPNPNETMKGGYSPLIYLVHVGDFDLTIKFVELGANVNKLDDLNGYALLEAANQGHQHIFDYLLPYTIPELRQNAIIALPGGISYRQTRKPMMW
jgi:ankyrin repeat protein